MAGLGAATTIFGQPCACLLRASWDAARGAPPKYGVMFMDVVLALTCFPRASYVLTAVVGFRGPVAIRSRLPDRATIANKAAGYGTTIGFFQVDAETPRRDSLVPWRDAPR